MGLHYTSKLTLVPRALVIALPHRRLATKEVVNLRTSCSNKTENITDCERIKTSSNTHFCITLYSSQYRYFRNCQQELTQFQSFSEYQITRSSKSVYLLGKFRTYQNSRFHITLLSKVLNDSYSKEYNFLTRRRNPNGKTKNLLKESKEGKTYWYDDGEATATERRRRRSCLEKKVQGSNGYVTAVYQRFGLTESKKRKPEIESRSKFNWA